MIHRASLVFLLKDIYSQGPVTNAVILCNGKQNPYTRKNDGHYVFSNLYPGEYVINITCSGYVPLELKVNLRENETQVIPLTMPYTVDNPAMRKITHFIIDIVHRKKAVAEQDIKLKLLNELDFMKLIENAAAQTDALKLNIEEMIPGLLGQTYMYSVNDKEYEFTITGFDSEKKTYILRDYLQEELPSGGTFYCVWNLKTDSSGRVTMPYMSQFMKSSEVKFECFAGGSKGKTKVDVAGKEQSAETLYTMINLRKIPAKDK